MALIGIDIGGTGIKASAFTHEGALLATAYREYAPLTCDGRSELDPREIWNCAREILREVCLSCGGQVEAISASSMGEMFVRFDEHDRIIGKSITYHDRRGQELYREFVEAFGEDAIRSVLGVRLNYIQSLHRLRLMQRTEPELMAKTKKISFMSGFVLHMLGAENCCDWSIALTTSCFDFKKRSWHLPYIQWAGLNPDIFPTPMQAGAVIGTITPRLADELGISPGAKLVLGPNDQLASMLAVAAHEPGEIYNGIGTVDSVVTFTHDESLALDIGRHGMFCGLHCLPDTYVLNTGAHYAGGAVLTWFREHFGLREKDLWQKKFYAEYDRHIPEKPTDLLVVCHFAGMAGDPFCKGAILNLTMDTSNAELYRAFMEGETYVARTRVDKIRAAGLPAKIVKTVGGAARSDAFMQIRADNFRLPVAVMDCDESGALGNAILGGAASGIYRDIREAAGNMTHIRKIYEPSAKYTAEYDQMYERYKRAYEALKPLE